MGAARILGIAIVVVIAAASAGFMLSSAGQRNGPRNPPESPLQRQEAANRKLAAAWVAQQVSPDAVVSCDRQTCSALVAAGFPADKVLVLGPTSPDPPDSALVIVTASVRSLFGSILSSQWAPAVLTTVGAGAAQITIRVIEPHGAAAYQIALSTDLQNRKVIGGELLNSNQINQSAIAAKQMAAGLADLRLLVAITALADSHPVDIVDFGNLATGASAGIPLRYADLAENGKVVHLSNAAYLHAMLAAVDALQADYRPMRTETVKLKGGVSVLRIEFGAPTPLGLLAPQSPTGG